jgi:tRNA threonylcarbamoyladenosine biosynthesis protein TsaB
MKILSIDTTTKVLTLGIYNNGIEAEYNLEVGRLLSRVLDKTVERVSDASGVALQEIDYFALGLGPGSFTGMRVGISFVKGLSWANNKPIIGISTLDILAQNIKENGLPIVSAIDAKRNLVYASIYTKKSGQLRKISPYMLLTVDELVKKSPKGSIILGDAVSLYKEKLQKDIKGSLLLDKEFWYPKAHNIIALALQRIKGKKIHSAFNVKPIYLYPKFCQVKQK